MSQTKVVVLSNNFAAVKKSITGAMLMQAAEAGGGVVETFAKLNASGGRPGLNVDTGNLVNSITVHRGAQTETYADVEVGTGVEYAAIHEFGGVIMPIAAKMLSWVDNGARVFAKMVHIPARPYLRPAIDEHEAEITKAVETALKMQIEQAAA